MKKIIALLATVLVVSGCTLFSQTKDIDSLYGVLSSQDPSDSYQGTHLLTEENGTETPLSSTALNLSSPQYLGNFVSVQGKIDETTGVFDVTGISILEVLEKDEGAVKWIEYMDQKMGFKWKYYDNWEVVDFNKDATKSEIQFLAPSNSASGHDAVWVDKFESSSVPVILKEVIGDNAESYFQSDVKIGANQNSAKKYIVNETEAEVYLLTRENFIYVITFFPLENIKADENKKIFYEMLAEFQFVPFATVEAGVEAGANSDEAVVAPPEAAADEAVVPETQAPIDPGMPESWGAEGLSVEEMYDFSDYSEFESLPYKFKAKYPSGWYYAGTTGSGDVLHRYDFSDKPVTAENIFASLEVLSIDAIPSGQKVQITDFATIKYQGDEVYFYMKVGDRVYSVHGKKELEETLRAIIASITPVTTVAE